MITIKGVLNVGLDYAGKTHQSFEIRAPKVKDTIESMTAAGTSNNLKFMLEMYSRQLVSVGDIPKEHLTAELLSDLYDVDLAVIQEASQNLEKKLMTAKQI